jgi:peptidoglycan/xylan/chitin deacetylase (PgdA/CDA1 family)
MSKRELAYLLDSTGVIEAILRRRERRKAPRLTVLTYHRVGDHAEEQPFDRGVIDATVGEFQRQIQTLKSYYNVIGLDELFDYLRGGTLPANPAIITFDDGYRECHDRALPVLLAHGVRAVFFVATRYISERRVFWWDRIAYMLNRTREECVELRYPVQVVLTPKASWDRAMRVAVDIVKRTPGLDVERYMEGIAQATGVAWSAELERTFADELLMTWDQVMKLRAAGMEVQSHTRTHRILQMIAAHELMDELAGARADLEEHLGERVRGLAYPLGRSTAQSPKIRAAVREAGYDVAFSNGTGLCSLSRNFDPLNVQRISVERGLPHSYFRALLAIPAFSELKLSPFTRVRATAAATPAQQPWLSRAR